MNRYGTRMKQIEERSPRLERQFVGWASNPWTPEQMAKAIRQHPQQRVFLRSLLETARESPRALEGGALSPPHSPVPLCDLTSVPSASSVVNSLSPLALSFEPFVSSVAHSLSPPGAFTRAQLQAMSVVLDYQPHAAQLEIHRARDKRFRMVSVVNKVVQALLTPATVQT